MRFIQPLTTDQKRLLKRLYEQSRFFRVRTRAHCILLSANGYSTTELRDIFQVTRATLYNWFDAWDAKKFAAL
jgi:transposase